MTGFFVKWVGVIVGSLIVYSVLAADKWFNWDSVIFRVGQQTFSLALVLAAIFFVMAARVSVKS